jgi:hypothetical protein
VVLEGVAVDHALDGFFEVGGLAEALVEPTGLPSEPSATTWPLSSTLKCAPKVACSMSRGTATLSAMNLEPAKAPLIFSPL